MVSKHLMKQRVCNTDERKRLIIAPRKDGHFGKCNTLTLLLVTRERISDDHWDLIKKEKQALGYDREAYEHSLQLPKVFKRQSASIPVPGADGRLMFPFRLGGRLDSAETVKEVAGLDQLPEVREGVNDVGAVKFCVIDQEVQQKLEQWLTQQAVLQERVDIAQAWMSQAVALAPRIEPGQVELNATLGPCTCVLYAHGRVLTQPIITRYMDNYPLWHKFASVREEMQTSVLLVQL